MACPFFPSESDTMDPKTIATDILKELISDIPAIAGAVHQWAGIKGFDLGPAPPNARTGVEAVDADIDRQLEALKNRG